VLFRGVRKGKRVRWAAGNVPVFGMLKRGGHVYTKIIPMSAPLTSCTSSKPRSNSIPSPIPTLLALMTCSMLRLHHHCINHRDSFVLGAGRHISGTENFWNQAMRHLRHYNGIPRYHFHFFLKECEWRFNYGPPNSVLESLETWISLSTS
jgi:transposase